MNDSTIEHGPGRLLDRRLSDQSGRLLCTGTVFAFGTRPEFKSVQAPKGKTVAILVFGGVAHFAA